MKTAVQATEVTTDGIGQSNRATIRTSAKIFNALSSQIYSNPYVAIWRELVANGVDAQKITGETRRPVVTLPSALDPIAKVRDWGTGMGHDFMMNQFMAFGDATTKESSDDMIGGFGIGSKAPLAYTEQYSITNFRDGVKRIYSVYKDSEGCPCIAYLSETPTDEPNGVEVSFPVRQDDIPKFNDVAIQTMQYFDPLPELANTQLKLEPVEYQSRGDTWGIDLSRKSSQVIIGGVAYPLDLSKMSYSQRDKYPMLHQFGSLGLDIFMPIADAGQFIALSREHVSHSDELFAKLEGIISEAMDDFGTELSKTFEDAPTLWEAKARLNKALMGLAPREPRYKLVKKYATYDGQRLTETLTRPNPEEFPVEAIFYGIRYEYNTRRNLNTTSAVAPRYGSWDPTARLRPTDIDKIIIQDEAADRPLLRVRTAIEDEGGSNLLFIRAEDNFDWVKFLAEFGNPEFEVLSNYQPKKVVRQPSTAPARPFKVYVRPNRPYLNSLYQTELPKGGGIYIRMDNFDLQSSLNQIEIAQLTNPTNTIWLNKTDFANADVENDPEWLSVEEAVVKAKAEYKSKYSRIAWAEAYYAWTHKSRNRGRDFEHLLKKLSNFSKFPKRGPLFQLERLRQEFMSVNTHSHHLMRDEVLEVKCDDQYAKILALAKAARTKYPLIFELDNASRYDVSEDIWNRLF